MKPSKIKMKNLGDGYVQIDCMFDAADVKNALRMSYRMLAYTYEIDSRSDSDIPGLLEDKLGHEQVEVALTQSVAAALAPFVIDALDFFTVLDYQVLDAQTPTSGAELSFSMKVMPQPEFELSSYEPVHVVVPRERFSEEEINGYLAAIVGECAHYDELGPDEAAQPGDRVVFDMETSREFGPVPYLTGKGREAVVGEGWLTREFDESVQGMHAGQSKSFKFEALTESSQDESDKEVLYAKIKLRQIFRPESVDLSDAWVAANVPDVSSVQELRAKIELEMLQRTEMPDGRREMRALVASAMAERLNAKISDQIYEYAVNELLSQIDQQAQTEGVSFEEYLDGIGLSMDNLGEAVMQRAKAQLLQGFALDAWFRHFNLAIDDKDVDEAIGNAIGSENLEVIRSQREQLETSGHGYIARRLAQRYKASKDALASAVMDYS